MQHPFPSLKAECNNSEENSCYINKINSVFVVD